MKHLANSYRENLKQALGRSALNWMLQLALIALLNVLALDAAIGQCSLACRGGSPNTPLSVFVDEDCKVNLSTDELLVAPGLCPGDKLITVRDTMSNIVATDTNMVFFDAEAYYGQVLSVTITNIGQPVFCNSFIELMDTFPPRIECLPDTISCIDDASVDALGTPLILDNCPETVVVTHSDVVFDYGCDTTAFRALIERTWIAEDLFGNRDTCVQPIYILRPALQDVVFPRDTVLACGGPAPTLAITGRPKLDGRDLLSGNGCGLHAYFQDDTLSTCGGIERRIIRNWRVLESCSNLSISHDQIIQIVDTIAPQIICPAPLTVNTLTGVCYATVTLPSPTVTDNCDSEASFFVSTSYGAVGTGPHLFVPAGSHLLQYTAIDNCGNQSTCTSMLHVVDDEEPAAVCREFTTVSIPTGGYAQVAAHVFNGGSTDNCVSTLYYKVRRMTIGGCNQVNGDDSQLTGYQEWFDDKVFFCCEEVGSSVQLLLHVYEINPGDGPIDPTREQPGGDLFGRFNECMVFVDVQDKLAPVLNCPQNLTVNCDADHSDLSVFGSPIVTDNCGYTLDSLELINLNECGSGEIIRTFRAMDPSGNVGICVQTITVENIPVTIDNIVWPADYTLTVCGGAVDPNSLPLGHRRPEIVNAPCNNVGITYEDELFNISFPACYKILRRWIVIDWCEYDPEYPQNGGRFTKVQIIKVEDNQAPILTCPANVVVPISNTCGSANVTLPSVTAQDCNPNVLITNDSPFAATAGPNASGTYPLGTTLVKFSAADRCGNVATCQVSVKVEDQTPPSPICIVGLSINLSNNNGEGQAILQATAFNSGSSDNCTSSQNLVFTIRRGGTGDPNVRPTTTSLTFGCADVGNQLIEFWAMDAAGNSNRCNTVVAIQDNNRVCPQQVSGMIRGNVRTEEGEFVEDVMVQVSSNNPMTTYTGINGFFELLNVPFGSDYTVSARRDNDVMNGVSTLDLVLINKHILGIQLLDSPYKMIAADVNKSGSISTLDMIVLRKMILGLESNFPNGNKSWRFIHASHVFPNPANPFATPFPEVLNINNFTFSQLQADFIAVKVGDVDNSAVPTSLTGIEERIARGTFAIQLPEQAVEAGQTFSLPFTAEGAHALLGYQFTLGFAADALEFVELQTGSLPGLSLDNFNLQAAAEGRIATSWNLAEVQPENAATDLFHITFRAKRPLSSLQSLFHIGSIPTAAEAYDEEGRLLDVSLRFGQQKASVATGFELYQNTPNPFSTETVVSFRLPQAGQATLKVYSLAGQAIHGQTGYFEAGYHEIRLSRSMLPTSGLLYYQLETAEFSATKKMILME